MEEDEKKVLVSIKLNPDLLAKLDKIAEKENRSRSNLIETILVNSTESVKK